MRTSVRILLVGDDQVGKSTLVMSLIREAFVQNIQHVVPEVTIPAEVTSDNVTTHIVDSSARPENRDQLDAEIRRADVICIIYAVDRQDTFDNIHRFWLPHIRSLGRSVPVIVVGNMIDRRNDDADNMGGLENMILPLMNDFREIETCVECSAKQLLNISEIFHFAQNAVLHPTAPLYDSREHTLKPQCVSALRRIFKLCDMDKDGVLNDEELNEFQRKCFKQPLQQQELEGVKEVVRENQPDGVNERGLTEDGFVFLNQLFIQRGRLETTWTVLRMFGYGDDLSLREDFLYPSLEIPPDCAVELTPTGYDFFTQLFTLFDKDKDGALKESELDDLFSTSPGNPWLDTGFPHTTITNDAGAVTLQGFLAQWSMTTLVDHRTTLAYLAYLGFPNDTLRGVRVTKPRKRHGKRVTHNSHRHVFLCYVFGATGSGKTSLLKKFVNKPFAEGYHPTTRPFNVVNSVEIGGVEKYLVMQEFGPKGDVEVLSNRRKLEMCDIVCLVYDSSDVNSFAYLANLRKQYDLDSLPLFFVATKSDQDRVHQRSEVQPDAYCRQLGLAPPHSVSVLDNNMADVYSMLVSVAMYPSTAIPGHHNKNTNWSLKTWTTIGIVGAVFAISTAIIVRHLHKS